MSGEPFSAGKLRWDVLRSTIYSHLGVEDARVLVGPRIGEDAAIIVEQVPPRWSGDALRTR